MFSIYRLGTSKFHHNSDGEPATLMLYDEAAYEFLKFKFGLNLLVLNPQFLGTNGSCYFNTRRLVSGYGGWTTKLLKNDRSHHGNDFSRGWLVYLLSYYLANKRSLHVCSQSLEISTLIKKRKIKITHHCHYEKISLKYPYTYL